MSVNTITSEIIGGTLSNDELNKIIDAVKFARSQLTQVNRRSLVIGTRVKFTNNKTGNDITGTVKKVALKYITVESTSGLWRVPGNMLSIA
jgi:hypothetical protein